MVSAVITALVLIAAALGFYAFKFFQEAQRLRNRYSPIADVEAEAALATMVA